MSSWKSLITSLGDPGKFVTQVMYEQLLDGKGEEGESIEGGHQGHPPTDQFTFTDISAQLGTGC